MYTKTGYVENHFSVGPAILWAPVMLAVHGTVLLADHFGAHIAADGYSRPYLLAMALTTACYGFLSLFLAFRIARKYFDEQWAFLATIGIWLASSLPIYMYFNPSWSHALSSFTVALFLWYWDRTRLQRTAGQWAILGLMAGLMGNVYYPNVILLIFPALEVVYLLRAQAARSRPAHGPNSRIGAQLRRVSRGFFRWRFSPRFSRGRSSTEARLKPAIRRFRRGIGLLLRCSRFCFPPIMECLAGPRS